MPDEFSQHHAVVHPEDILPDHADYTEVGGLVLRKGTVAAFLQNALRWSDPATGDTERALLARAMVAGIPAMRALGVLAVFELRDARLRTLLDRD